MSTYTTSAGDTFDLISYKLFKTCRHTEKLINANRQFVDTVIFEAGVELNVPDVSNQRTTNLPPWRTE